MAIEATSESLTMQLRPTLQTPHIRGSFERKSEREAIRRELRASEHADEGFEGILWGVGLGESADECVVHEDVWVWDVEEEAASVVECVGYIHSALNEELSGNELVGFETGLADVSVELLDALQSLAGSQERKA